MKIIDPAVKARLESEEYRQAILLDMEIGGVTDRFTTWSQDLAFGITGPMYLSKGMQINNISYNTVNIVDSVSVEIDDVDRGIFASLGDEAADDFPFKLRLAVLDSYGGAPVVIGSIVVFTGVISQWEYVPGKVKIVASSIFKEWSRVTLYKFGASCRWRIFKGTECKYSGEGTSCDRTYDQCTAYNNIDNFGGQRWLPSLVGLGVKAL